MTDASGESPEAVAALIATLRAARWALDDEIREAWDRSVPFADAVGDRRERARRLGFGDGSTVYDSCLILGDVTVGANTWVGPNTILDGSGARLTIGDHCCISAGAQVYTHDTVLRSVSGGTMPRATGPTTIGDRCYIGPNVIVRRNVAIGNQCVVGANSYVNRDVPPNTVVAGTPAQPIGRAVGSGADVRIELRLDDL